MEGRIRHVLRSSFYKGLATELAYVFRDDQYVYNLIAKNVEPVDRPSCFEGIGIIRALRRDAMVRIIGDFDRGNLSFFYKGVGEGLMLFKNYDTVKVKAIIAGVPQAYQAYCLEGMAHSTDFFEYQPNNINMIQKDLLDLEARSNY